MTNPVYPENFPLPLWAAYNYNVDMQVIRTPFDIGYQRQRRTHKLMPHIFSVTFRMKEIELGAWQDWVNDNAYNWFDMPVNDMYSSSEGKVCTVQTVRFIGDLAIRMRHAKYFDVTTQMELAPKTYSDAVGAIIKTEDWIIAKDPADPSTPDWYVARTPANPATDMVNPGNPRRPAATV